MDVFDLNNSVPFLSRAGCLLVMERYMAGGEDAGLYGTSVAVVVVYRAGVRQEGYGIGCLLGAGSESLLPFVYFPMAEFLLPIQTRLLLPPSTSLLVNHPPFLRLS